MLGSLGLTQFASTSIGSMIGHAAPVGALIHLAKLVFAAVVYGGYWWVGLLVAVGVSIIIFISVKRSKAST